MEIIIGIIIVVVAILIFGYYSRKKIYKEVDRLESWKIDIMNCPVTDEISKVKELNMTGQTEELFERWRSEWDEIVTVALPDVEELLFDAEDFADKYRFTKAKRITAHIESILQASESDISRILLELKELVGSEEKNRVEIEELKKLHRDIKKTLLAHRLSFGKSENMLENELHTVQEKFKEFEETTKNGNYLEAREVVLFIRDSLDTIQNHMEEIPKILHDCNTIIPNQLNEIKEGLIEMEAQGFSVEHLQVDKEIDTIRIQLKQYVTLTEALEITEVQKGLNETKETIETLYDLLEKEVKANQFVNNEIEEIENTLQNLIENSKKSEEETEFVQQSYHLTEADLEKHQEILKQIKQVVKKYITIQTRLDEEQVAYSIVQGELEEVFRTIKEIKEEHSKFTEMLQTLRKDEMNARDKIKELKKTLLDAKRMISKSNIPGLPSSYTDLLSDAQESVYEVVKKLDEKPLDMSAVNETLQSSLSIVSKTFEATEELVEQVYLAEKVIQYGNRYRRNNKVMAESLQKAENSFRNYDYALALEQAATALEEIEPDALKRIEKIIENE